MKVLLRYATSYETTKQARSSYLNQHTVVHTNEWQGQGLIGQGAGDMLRMMVMVIEDVPHTSPACYPGSD
ncbi:DUF1339 domain protein [Aspergillus luchuensis]|uniref:DUF1339 domain protein n=1 Tax=Aspergillus kawachii TaxID=1069201 RepID=A0A146FPS6_ASPKA|nr:DUF1339 domain protein [Aspergillus luchuensis]